MSEEDTNIKPDLPDPPKLDLGDEVSLTKKMLQSAPTEEIKNDLIKRLQKLEQNNT